MVRRLILVMLLALLILGWLSGCGSTRFHGIAEGQTHAPHALSIQPTESVLYLNDHGAWWHDRNDYGREAEAAYSAPVITRQRIVERTYDEQYSSGGRIRDRYRTRRDSYTESYQYGR